MDSMSKTVPLSIEEIAQRILIVRGKRVLLDADLAALYRVTTKRFNEQVSAIWRAFRKTSCSS